VKKGKSDHRRKARRSPLAGLFGGPAPSEEPDLPAMDVAAGLDRALRGAARRGAIDPPPNAGPAGNIREALLAIEGALFMIDKIRDIIEQAYEIALSAHEAEDAGARALLAESFDEIRLSINAAVDSVDDKASALIGKNPRQIDVKLGGKAHYSVSPCRLDASPKGLAISPPREAFASFEEIGAALDELDSALRKADRAAAAYCRDAQFLIAKLQNA
jgi:hypothetical protein